MYDIIGQMSHSSSVFVWFSISVVSVFYYFNVKTKVALLFMSGLIMVSASYIVLDTVCIISIIPINSKKDVKEAKIDDVIIKKELIEKDRIVKEILTGPLAEVIISKGLAGKKILTKTDIEGIEIGDRIYRKRPYETYYNILLILYNVGLLFVFLGLSFMTFKAIKKNRICLTEKEAGFVKNCPY